MILRKMVRTCKLNYVHRYALYRYVHSYIHIGGAEQTYISITYRLMYILAIYCKKFSFNIIFSLSWVGSWVILKLGIVNRLLTVSHYINCYICVVATNIDIIPMVGPSVAIKNIQ